VITPAIFELLNVPNVTNLAKAVYSLQAPQRAVFPLIIINENTSFELFKQGIGIKMYDVQIDIYSDRQNNGALKELDLIKKAVESELLYYSGVVQGRKIDTITIENEDNFFDPVSEKYRVMIQYKVREDAKYDTNN
jgi:hypothetical protein